MRNDSTHQSAISKFPDRIGTEYLSKQIHCWWQLTAFASLAIGRVAMHRVRHLLKMVNEMLNGKSQQNFEFLFLLFCGQFWTLAELSSMHRRTLNVHWNVPFGRIGFVAARKNRWTMWWCFPSKCVQIILVHRDAVHGSYFSSLFGIPLVFEENQTDSLIDAMLTANSTDAAAAALANDANSELYIDADEMQTFFHFIGRRSARFSDEAEHLLRDYFMATRLNRATLLSPRSLAILRQMSECHAKLCLRDCVYR